jgi:hypothetical protein
MLCHMCICLQIIILHNLYSVMVIIVSLFYSMELNVSHLDRCLDVWHVVGRLSVNVVA